MKFLFWGFLLIAIQSHSQESDCLTITIAQYLADSGLASYDYQLNEYGDILSTGEMATRTDDTSKLLNRRPFTIENKCLGFCISFMGCKTSYKMLWNGELEIDNYNRTIAHVRFVVKWKEDCERKNNECLKFDLSSILNAYSGKELYLDFEGYNKILKIK